MKKALKILRITITVFLSLILIANLWLIISRLIFRNELPKIFGVSQAIVITGSMEPEISAGDLLIFSEREEYKLQDVVIFRQNDDYVTHRIVEITDNGFITRGDANNTNDREILDPQLIEGKMMITIPGIGGMLSFLRTPLGILVLILIGVLMIEGPYILARFRRKQVM